MKVSTALERLREGHLVLYESMRSAPTIDIRRVSKAERERVRVGPVWFDRKGRCLKQGMTATIRPLTREVRDEIITSAGMVPWKGHLYGEELDKLGDDKSQFPRVRGVSGLLAGDPVIVSRPRKADVKSRVRSVTDRFVYVDAYRYDRKTGRSDMSVNTIKPAE